MAQNSARKPCTVTIMTNEIWSWLLTAAGATTAVASLSGFRHAWLVGLFTQALWLIYGLSSHLSGFVASVVIFSSIYVHARLRKIPAVAAAATACRTRLTCTAARLTLYIATCLASPQPNIPEQQRARAGHRPGAGTQIVMLSVIPQTPGEHDVVVPV
jgi:hypothetical protein